MAWTGQSQAPLVRRIRSRFGRLVGAFVAVAAGLTFPYVIAPPASAATAAEISAGYYSSCALTTVGGVKCWGTNGFGSLGNGTTTDSLTPVDVSGLTSGVTQISVGFLQACALTTAGGVKCWGSNGDGQLGNGTTTDSLTPVDVSGLSSGVAQISAGYYHTCAITTGGAAKCWGNNDDGKLGNGTTTGSSIPVNVSGLSSGATQISAGMLDTCAIAAGGAAKCWGNNRYGELGNGTKTSSSIPVDVSGLSSGVAQVFVGNVHTCALTVSGVAKCWGNNNYGQLGNGTTTESTTPRNVAELSSGVTQISVGDYFACVVTTGSGAKCWGSNFTGELGNGTTATTSNTPLDVSGLSAGVTQISAGSYHACALATENGAQCWGWNSTGQLGSGSTTDSRTPVNVVGLSTGGVFQPDALIKRSYRKYSATYVGDGIYNTTAQDQRVTGKAGAGNSATFDVEIQNDGSRGDSITLVGCSRSPGFVVKYFTSTGSNITASVTAGTQSTGSLYSGEAYRFTLRIRAKLIAVSGAEKACRVTATSVGDGTKRDVVKATLIVR